MNLNLKSNFLEKKRQERKKTQEQIEIKSRLLALQKNLRAFIVRKRIVSKALQDSNVAMVIHLGADISQFTMPVLVLYLQNLLQQPPMNQPLLLSKLLLSCMRTRDTPYLSFGLNIAQQHHSKLETLFSSRKYAQVLVNLIKKGYGLGMLEISWPKISQKGCTKQFPTDLLLQIAFSQYGSTTMESEEVPAQRISMLTTLFILNELSQRSDIKLSFTPQLYISVGSLLSACLSQSEQNGLKAHVEGLALLVGLLRQSLVSIFERTVSALAEKHKHLLSLVEDEEQLKSVENIMRSQPQYDQFCDYTTKINQQLFISSAQLHLLMGSSQKFRQALSAFIGQLSFIYEDKRIMYVYKFLSDANTLREAYKQKKAQFFSALKMRLMTMDDEEFKVDKIFDEKEWKDIIETAIFSAFEITKKSMAIGVKKDGKEVRERLFRKKQENQLQLQILSDLLQNLNKKCLRTQKIPNEYFINSQLDKLLNIFKFGTGARVLELMLKNFPFVFRFESRIRKLRQFIKADKLNHDRSLFLQEEVDPELIIEVRRGHQFLDAFGSCAHKDLRKKYKIVFFNQQGLEEEGIDGGGIIKQFINRVLKSSFSEVYGMFYQTEQNEILPNSYSTLKEEYEFVGKIIGKAVYESINIQQKFAEPFLNLLIGRQNTFEDLQFIDRQVYHSMLDIRRMGAQDLQCLQQTFTILDQNPFGDKKYVNLKHLSDSANKNPETVVNDSNKVEFVMSYADFKCNKQLEEKTRLFRRGFLTVMKSEWLTMFSNQELNLIISGSSPNFSIMELRNNVVYNDYNQKSQTIMDFWSVLSEFSPEEKSSFLLFVTSCSRPPTMGFGAMKPLICIQKSGDPDHLPTANTCMNVLRLPDYQNKQKLRQKLLYAINSKAGFEFA